MDINTDTFVFVSRLSCPHQLRLLQVVFAYGGHELQVFVLLIQRHHLLLLVLQPLLSTGQLVPQPLILLTETTHLRRTRRKGEEGRDDGEGKEEDVWEEKKNRGERGKKR